MVVKIPGGISLINWWKSEGFRVSVYQKKSVRIFEAKRVL